MQCLINGISHDGQGVARLDGKVVFVPGALPGEEVDIELVAEKKSFARGRLISVCQPVEERVEPPCPYYGTCGGCDYQHASYELQVELKTRVVEQTLQRLGGLSIEVAPCLAALQPWRYRNKVTWHAAYQENRWQMGYYQSETKDILPVENCLLISEAMQSLSNTISNALGELPPSTSPLEITIRESSWNKTIMLIISGLNPLQHKDWVNDIGITADSIFLFHKQSLTCLKGTKYLQEMLAVKRYDLSPLVFFQINPEQSENMIRVIRAQLDLQGGEQILDAYCGVGTIAINLAAEARRVVGIEAFPQAVDDAKHNARLNDLKNCRFLGGSTEQVLPTISQRFDMAILDPPRSGCDPKVIQAVARQKIPRVIYVSCEPSTLARNLAGFQQAGYRITTVQPLDMFPQTKHVETVVRLDRGHITK